MNSMRGGGDHAAAMEATFPHRRRMIVKEKLSMDQVAERFPSLFTADGMWQEAGRLAENPHIKEDNLRDMNKMMANVQNATKCPEGEEISNLLMTLQEDRDAFVVESQARDPLALYPHVVRSEGMYALFIEGMNVASCDNFKEAVVLLVWALSIFHQKYSKKIKKTTVFLERYVLGVYHPVKVPLVVSEVLHKIGRP